MLPLIDLTRRKFLRLGLLGPGALALAAVGCQPTVASRGRAALAQELPLTPACDENPATTPPQTAGPFFTPNSPERQSLVEPGVQGMRLVLTGYVVSRQCRGVSGALLDFWQADSAGAYDNVGYRLRGHQYADADGRYELETVVPGLYTGRTRHIHVRVQPAAGRILTTQLYFPDEPGNLRDRIYNPALAMTLQTTDDARWGSFNFVVDAG